MKKMKKLMLSRETLRALGTQDLSPVAGGIVFSDIKNCPQTGAGCEYTFALNCTTRTVIAI